MRSIIGYLFFFFTVACLFAEDFNGGFEKVTADISGVPQPVGWVRNKVVSRNATVCLTKDSGTFRGGNFGLRVETEENGCLSFRSLKSVPVAAGDTIEMEIYAQGTGRYTLQYIIYGVDGSNELNFLSTYGTNKPAEAKEDKWECYSVKVEFNPPRKANGKYNKFAIIPVMFVFDNAEIVFDDFKINIATKK